MAQSLAKILVHVVFSTKDRVPFLRDAALRGELHRYQAAILRELDCQVITIGGVDDHVHILLLLARTVTVADAIKELKRVSTMWMKSQKPSLSDFAWQRGYGAFSLGVSQREAVIAYIDTQEEHHRRISFQDEFRALLKRYEIDFDERYVWD